MKTIRLVLSIVSALLLSAGYAGSQLAELSGNGPNWSRQIDQPPIAMLSLFLLAAALLLGAARDREEAS